MLSYGKLFISSVLALYNFFAYKQEKIQILWKKKSQVNFILLLQLEDQKLDLQNDKVKMIVSNWNL